MTVILLKIENGRMTHVPHCEVLTFKMHCQMMMMCVCVFYFQRDSIFMRPKFQILNDRVRRFVTVIVLRI